MSLLMSFMLVLNIKLCLSAIPFSYKNWTYLVHMTCGTNKCFGVLIQPNWVLTSASCLYTGLCKQINIGEPNDYFPVNVSGSIKYPYYEELPQTILDTFPINDIALIMLKTAINKVHYLNFSNKVPDRKLKCKYLVAWKDNLTEMATNNFLSCRVINDLFNIPDVDPWKVKNVCNKLCVTAQYVRSDNTLWGGPLVCNNQLQGIYSDTIMHDDQKKSSWTMPFAYLEWIERVIEYNSQKSDEGPEQNYSTTYKFNSFIILLFVIIYFCFK